MLRESIRVCSGEWEVSGVPDHDGQQSGWELRALLGGQSKVRSLGAGTARVAGEQELDCSCSCGLCPRALRTPPAVVDKAGAGTQLTILALSQPLLVCRAKDLLPSSR